MPFSLGSGSTSRSATILIPNYSVRSRTGHHQATTDAWKWSTYSDKSAQDSSRGHRRRRISSAVLSTTQPPLRVSSLTAWAKREPWPTTCLRGPRPITPLPRPLDNVKSRERAYRNPKNKSAQKRWMKNDAAHALSSAKFWEADRRQLRLSY